MDNETAHLSAERSFTGDSMRGGKPTGSEQNLRRIRIENHLSSLSFRPLNVQNMSASD
jgi:hypothetical protein